MAVLHGPDLQALAEIAVNRGEQKTEGSTPNGTRTARRHRCPFSKLNPRGFIGGCDRLAIACVHGHSDRRSIVGLPKRTPNPHRAGAESDRAATSPSWSSPR